LSQVVWPPFENPVAWQYRRQTDVERLGLEHTGIRTCLDGNNFFAFAIRAGNDDDAPLNHVRIGIARRRIGTQIEWLADEAPDGRTQKQGIDETGNYIGYFARIAG
jgi:hypothetical protein